MSAPSKHFLDLIHHVYVETTPSVMTELLSVQAQDRKAFFMFARWDALDLVLGAIESLRRQDEFVGSLMTHRWPEVISEAIEAAEALWFE